MKASLYRADADGWLVAPDGTHFCVGPPEEGHAKAIESLSRLALLVEQRAERFELLSRTRSNPVDVRYFKDCAVELRALLEQAEKGRDLTKGPA